MGNCCKGERKGNANATERSGRKYLQDVSTSPQRVEMKEYKKRSKRELIARLQASESDRKSEQEKYQRWASEANNHYTQELQTARQQIRQAENNLEVEKQKHEQRERLNKEKYMNEIQVARQKTEQTEKKLDDATKRKDIDRQKFTEEISKLHKENKQLQDEKESLLSRFSAIAAAKLTDGNANIADLSDENRPTKISEMYSELYDNEWTDAFVVLTKDGKWSEKDACLTLAKALGVIALSATISNLKSSLTFILWPRSSHVFLKATAYDVCQAKATEDMGNLTKALTVFYECKEPPIETLKQIKDQRKRLFANHSQAIMKKYREQVGDIFQDEDSRKSEDVDKFLKKCAQVCWLMVIQDPQVFVDTNLNDIGKHFDTDRYKTYTKTGTYVDFIVWPTLYLHKGGDILMKGVAQGASDKQRPDYENVSEYYRQTPDGKIKIPPDTSLDHAKKNDALNASGIPREAENKPSKMKTNIIDTTGSGRKLETPKRETFTDWQNKDKETNGKGATVVIVKH